MRQSPPKTHPSPLTFQEGQSRQGETAGFRPATAKCSYPTPRQTLFNSLFLCSLPEKNQEKQVAFVVVWPTQGGDCDGVPVNGSTRGRSSGEVGANPRKENPSFVFFVTIVLDRSLEEEIHELLLSFAEAGANVVRLKGSDPLVFGRGGEEMDFLQQQGIEVKVIPGITAAELGIPLTHRVFATSVRFLTVCIAILLMLRSAPVGEEIEPGT
ncbi:UNVERIFIED_CONTAM: Siroheme synthase [Sesamum radiatum]|uniref:Siroheme synthase n=1 Tax=Sesamum radiatum TaxID=300843 RepID=A0AAW2L1D5_SESRA